MWEDLNSHHKSGSLWQTNFKCKKTSEVVLKHPIHVIKLITYRSLLNGKAKLWFSPDLIVYDLYLIRGIRNTEYSHDLGSYHLTIFSKLEIYCDIE